MEKEHTEKTKSCDGEEYSEDSVHSFGWFSFTPSSLQKLCKGVWVLVFLTAANTIVSGTYNGLSGAVQSSLETRFQLSSTQSSWIMTSFDVAAVFSSLLFAYIGSKPNCHRMRVITISLVLAMLACLLYALPHFTTPVYEPTGDVKEEDDLCRNRTNVDMCLDEDSDGEPNSSSIQNYLAVFIIARILLSFGVTPLTMLGLVFLDDCVSKETYSFFSGIFVCGWIGGPALGFVFGGMFLSVFTDFASEPDIDIDPSDPRWVGAWWLGFIFAAICLGIVIIPISGYPVDLPGAAEIRKKKKTEAFNSGTEQPSGSMKIDFTAKDIISYLKYLFTNWTFVFLTLFVTCDIAIMSGFTVFGPKYVEVQFNLTPAQAGILFGCLVVPAAFIGSISGGFMVKRLGLSLIGLLKWSIFLASVVLVGGMFILFHCKDAKFAGVNEPYPHDSFNQNYEDLNITHECNQDCWCDDIVFSPVCQDGIYIQYFSPCHAGCTEKEGDTYYNCSCVSNSTHSSVTAGVCPSNSCPNLVYFCVTLFIVMIVLFMNCTMDMSSMVRSVPPTHRVLGFLLYNMAQKILGAVPAPVIFGIAFDKSCQLAAETCDIEQGACYYYDKRKLSIGLFATCGAYKALSIIFVILAWKLYKPPKGDSMIEVEVTKEKEEKSYTNGDINKAFDSIHESVENTYL